MIPNGCIYECRGCKHREWTIEESLKQKYSYLANKLSLWVDMLEPVVSVPEYQRWGYRHKTTLNAKWDENGWYFGMMAKDELIDIPNCPLHKSEVNRILKLLRENLPSGSDYPLAFYVQASAQVVLIVKSRIKLDNSWITENVKEQLIENGVKGLWVHYNPAAGRRLFEKTQW
jgi:23S rRNA (uracil1939-C5)-methyltransferase